MTTSIYTLALDAVLCISRSFSRIIPRARLDWPGELRRRLRVVQQCRSEDLDLVRRIYDGAGIAAETAAFFTDLPARLATTHLVIARAGAGTVSELAVAGRPSVLVPYPHATDDHQTRNAEVLSSAGGAWVLAEADGMAASLTAHLTKLMRSEEHTSELQSRRNLGCRLLLEKKNSTHPPLPSHH